MSKDEIQWLIDRRIVCDEGGYPSCEARFLSVKDYVHYLEEQLKVSDEMNYSIVQWKRYHDKA